MYYFTLCTTFYNRIMRAWNKPSSETRVVPETSNAQSSSICSQIYEQVLQKKRKTLDELESYLSLGPEFVPDGPNGLLLYWKTTCCKWPHLASMARDYLAVPASSAGSERSFSTGRDMLGLNRHSLLPESMEASIRLRSWFRAGLDIDQCHVIWMPKLSFKMFMMQLTKKDAKLTQKSSNDCNKFALMYYSFFISPSVYSG